MIECVCVLVCWCVGDVHLQMLIPIISVCVCVCVWMHVCVLYFQQYFHAETLSNSLSPALPSPPPPSSTAATGSGTARPRTGQ